MRLLLLLTVFLLQYTFSFAGNDSIMGYVKDQDNNILPGASVFFNDGIKGTVTDSSGSFKLINVLAVGDTITVSYTGYKSKVIILDSNYKTPLNIIMQRDVLSLEEVLVRDERIFSASSSQAFNAFDFELRIKESAQDLLQVVPGLITAQHAGGGKAEQIFLRGFDADHGTDVNISVDGIPVNMVSHAHGQGYADLHFVIPEILKGLEVQKGPYSPANGDFATAGAVKFKTLDDLDNDFIKIERGSYNSLRAIGAAKLPLILKNTSSYIAGEFLQNDSYFESKQNFNRYNLFAKSITDLTSASKLSFSLSGFASSWDASGQVPLRAVKSGIIHRFGSLDNTEWGKTSRYNLNLQYTSNGENSSFSSQAYFTKYDFDLFSNFTFFLNDPYNGDQIEQIDDRILYGYNGAYTFNGQHFGISTITTIGASIRADDMDVELWHTNKRSRLSPSVNAGISQKSAGIFIEEEVSLSKSFQIDLGLRGDYFHFDVNDYLYQSGTGTKGEFIVSPKLNIVYSASENLKLYCNSAYGFHSNDARVVISYKSENTLPKAFGMETGFRLKLFESVYLSSALWLLDLENEFVYVGDEGTTEANGPTRRIGADIDFRAQINSWLWWDMDFNLCHARFKGTNEYVPLAPAITSSGGLTARIPVGLDGSLRLVHISDRPANENNSVTALGSTIIDFSLIYKIGFIKAGVLIKNLFNATWNEAQFDTESRLYNEAEPVSELHFTPGSPRSFTITAEVEF